MKKIITLLLLTLALSLPAQEFWPANELEISPSGWDVDIFNTMLSSGTKPLMSFMPNQSFEFNEGSNDTTQPAVITETLYHEGRFLCLAFYRSGNQQYVLLCGEDSNTDISEKFNYYLNSISNAKIEFDKIFYSNAYNSVIIPVARYSDGSPQTIMIKFSYPHSGISSSKNDKRTNDVERFYNTVGATVNPANARGQIIIKKEGIEIQKIVNK